MTEALPATIRSKRFAMDGGRVFAGLIRLMVVLKLVAVFIYVPADRSIYDLGFSFDPYVRSLHEGRGFVSCEASGCDHSS